MLASPLLVEQHVARLHVAVHEAARVGGVECVRDLARRSRPRAPASSAPSRAQQRLEVGPVDVAHRDEQAPVDLAGLVDRDDVRVVEAGREPRLPQQPLAEALVLRESRGQHLERDRAARAARRARGTPRPCRPARSARRPRSRRRCHPPRFVCLPPPALPRGRCRLHHRWTRTQWPAAEAPAAAASPLIPPAQRGPSSRRSP